VLLPREIGCWLNVTNGAEVCAALELFAGTTSSSGEISDIFAIEIVGWAAEDRFFSGLEAGRAFHLGGPWKAPTPPLTFMGNLL